MSSASGSKNRQQHLDDVVYPMPRNPYTKERVDKLIQLEKKLETKLGQGKVDEEMIVELMTIYTVALFDSGLCRILRYD